MEIARPRPLQKKVWEKSIFSKKDRFPAFKSPFELTTKGVNEDTDTIKIYFYGA